MINFEEWNGFEGRIWKDEVNVRDFIQKNYHPYDGDESFLADPTDATNKLWGRLQELQKEEREKAGVSPRKYLAEVPAEEMNYEVGQEVKADIFSAGDKVDVTGISKGKGYTGTIKRYHAHMLPETHGAGPVHRHVGSMATTGRNNGRIEKNTPMPGHDGSLKTTNQNLEVIKVDTDKNYILVKGNVPGPKKGLVMVKTTTKKVKHVDAKELLVRTVAETKAEEVVEETQVKEAE